MNVLQRELKAGRKAFLFWSIGLVLIILTGINKYTAFRGDTNVTELIEEFPKLILAALGVTGVDLSTLGGFYANLVYYSLICMSIYAISLGCLAVNREVLDKTYEFMFMKPHSRSFLLSVKLVAAGIYIMLYSIINYLVSLLAITTLKTEETLTTPLLLFTVSMWLIGLLFCTLSAFLASLIKKPEKAFLFSNLIFLATFVFGVAYDMAEKSDWLRFFSPLKYFLPNDILAEKVDPVFIALCLLLSVVFYLVAMRLFDRKDLSA